MLRLLRIIAAAVRTNGCIPKRRRGRPRQGGMLAQKGGPATRARTLAARARRRETRGARQAGQPGWPCGTITCMAARYCKIVQMLHIVLLLLRDPRGPSRARESEKFALFVRCAFSADRTIHTYYSCTRSTYGCLYRLPEVSGKWEAYTQSTVVHVVALQLYHSYEYSFILHTAGSYM